MPVMHASGRRRRRRLQAEINVVPYIDVMLVLLIIFMVTAPLLNVGVDVNLPQSDARPLEQKKDPIVVKVARDGSLGLVWEGRDRPEPMDAATLVQRVRGFTSADRDIPVYVAGDRDANYQTVYEVLTLLQRDAGVARAGLMGEPAGK